MDELDWLGAMHKVGEFDEWSELGEFDELDKLDEFGDLEEWV